MTEVPCCHQLQVFFSYSGIQDLCFIHFFIWLIYIVIGDSITATELIQHFWYSGLLLYTFFYLANIYCNRW